MDPLDAHRPPLPYRPFLLSSALVPQAGVFRLAAKHLVAHGGVENKVGDDDRGLAQVVGLESIIHIHIGAVGANCTQWDLERTGTRNRPLN